MPLRLLFSPLFFSCYCRLLIFADCFFRLIRFAFRYALERHAEELLFFHAFHYFLLIRRHCRV